MIHANELKVGNLLYKDGIIVTIDARSIFDIWDKSDQYSPIPFSKEIMKQIGFVKIDEWAMMECGPRMAIRFLNFNSAECDIVQDSQVISFKCAHIKYLHQFQNLFYSFTYAELKLGGEK